MSKDFKKIMFENKKISIKEMYITYGGMDEYMYPRLRIISERGESFYIDLREIKNFI